MSRKVVGDVAVRVGADVGPLKIGLQDAGRSVRTFDRSVAQRASRLAKNIAGIGLAAAAMAGAVAAASGRAISALDKIGKKSAQIGITAEALQELAFAAKSAGVENASLLSSLERFSKRLGEAEQGFGAAKKQLEFLGIEARELTQIPLDQALGVIADRLSKLEDPTTRAAVAAGLFGREGVAMVNMLKDGSFWLNQTRQDARDMGAVIGNDVVKSAEDAEDRLGRLTDAIKAQLNEALVEAFPLIEKTAEGILYLATMAGDAVEAVKTLAATILDAFTQTEEEAARMIETNRSRVRGRSNNRPSGDGSGVQSPGDALGSALGGILPEPTGPTGPRAREAEERRAAEIEAAAEHQRQIEAARSDAQLIGMAEAYERKKELEAAQEEADTETETERRQREIEEAEAHRKELLERESAGMSEREKLAKQHADNMAKIAEMERRSREKGIADFWSNTTSLMQSGNDKLFKIGKAFSIAKAIIDGQEAAIGAYKVGARIGGPPLGAAFAAASIGATASMIMNIKNAQPSGGGGSVVGPGAGGVGPQGAGSVAAQEQQGASRPNVSLTLIGEQGFTRAQIVQIAEALNDSGDEGQELVQIRGRR